MKALLKSYNGHLYLILSVQMSKSRKTHFWIENILAGGNLGPKTVF